jgi:hypothetical protein
MLSSYQVTTTFFVDAYSADDAEALVAGLLTQTEDDEVLAIYSPNAIITGLDVDKVTYGGRSCIYDDELLPLLAESS